MAPDLLPPHHRRRLKPLTRSASSIDVPNRLHERGAAGCSARRPGTEKRARTHVALGE